MPERIPEELRDWKLSDDGLEKLKGRDGKVQLGTLGRGNHFLEFQSDEEGRLWLMIHSGSRAMGQAIAAHHLAGSVSGYSGKLSGLDCNDPAGQAYLNDMSWARKYGEQNRLAMMNATLEMLSSIWGIEANFQSLIHTDHNHVAREEHFGDHRLVHRKGAQRLEAGQLGIVPGSMGTCSFLVRGRGCAKALNSCSHGAGRKLSRTLARHKISKSRFVGQMKQVWFDHRKSNQLRDEAPEAYKDVREVMRCQRELVRAVAEHVPLLSFKGR
jgi:tRNA-splicing ligase RtcB